MKTLAERIKAAQTRRDEIAARMKELMDGADDNGRIADKEERKEYDDLADELSDVDGDLRRWKALEASQKTATPISGATSTEGSRSRETRERNQPRIEVKGLAKGTLFTRYAMAVAAGKGSLSDALAYAARWDGQTPEVSAYIKAVAGTAGGGSGSWGSELAEPTTMAGEFIELLMPRTVIGRISGFDMVPFNIRIIEQTSGSSVDWVGEKEAKPVGELAFDEFILLYNKIAGIVVISDELIRVGTPSAEEKVRNDLIKQIVKFMDEQFLLSTVTATAKRPAAVTNGATAVPASGVTADSFRYDLTQAYAPFDSAEIDTSTLHFAMPTAVARGLAGLTNMLGQREFPTITPQGGSLDGYPVIVSNSAPTGQIALIVAGEIAMADDGQVRLDASNQATLDMAGGNSPNFSLWQKNCTAMRAERWITYKKKRAHAVTRITGAAYTPQAPAGSPSE